MLNKFDIDFSLLLASSIVAAILLLIICATVLPKPLPGIPYNKTSAWRLYGDVSAMKEAQYRRQWIWKQPSQHDSSVSQIFIFPFRRPIVIVTDYRAVVEICSHQECIGLIAPNFHFAMQTKDPEFKSHKSLARGLMAGKALKEISAAQIYNKADSLIRLWDVKTYMSQGKPFRADRDIYLATLDIICTVAFGPGMLQSALQEEILHIKSDHPRLSHDPMESVYFSPAAAIPELESLLNATKMISVAQASIFPGLSQFLALLNPKNGLAYLNRKLFIRRQIESRLKEMDCAGSSECKCALDQLLRREINDANKAERLPNFYSATIRDEILGYLIAGHDTTAATMSWWVKYMSENQLVQSRLCNDLRQGCSNAYRDSRQPSVEEIYSIMVPYLDAVIEETLRRASVATLIVRTSTRDTQICGYNIPKGVDVMLSLTGPSLTEPAIRTPRTTRNSSTKQRTRDQIPYWGDDITQFKPERWLKMVKNADGTEVEKFYQKAGPSLSFSSGPRQCSGKNLAYLQLKLMMVLIIWNFELQPLQQSLNGPEIIEGLVNAPKCCYVKLVGV
ncbi:cytochrome P450 [Trichoderma velutinum]